jgi:adenylylsulfate kinase-like enzyme
MPLNSTMNKKKLLPGGVIWITGLSGSGKSTLALELVRILREGGESVVALDGDELREVFGLSSTNVNSHGREGRLNLGMQYARLGLMLSKQGFTVVTTTISLFREVHAWNRSNLHNYFEVYLKVPIEELRRRDPKDIYKRFDAGELKNVVGLDLPFDEPEVPDWIVEFEPNNNVSSQASDLLKVINSREIR